MEMKKNKIIEKIEPFNEFALGSCFSHSLVSVLSLKIPREQLLMTHSIKSLLTVNECFYFELINNNTSKLIEDKTVTVFEKSKYLEENILAKINENTPLIVGVDCFYLDIRPDTYKKRHIQHFLTVYGYDLARQIFHIIEHSYVNGFNYSKCEISMKCLKRAAVSFEKSMCEDKKSITEVMVKDGWDNYLIELKEKMRNSENQIIDCLEKNLNYLHEIIEKGFYYVNALSGIIQKYFHRLRMITFCMLKSARVNDNKKLTGLCEDCINLITFFAGAIERISYSKDISFFIYRKDDFLNRLKKFMDLQKSFFKSFIGGSEL